LGWDAIGIGVTTLKIAQFSWDLVVVLGCAEIEGDEGEPELVDGSGCYRVVYQDFIRLVGDWVGSEEGEEGLGGGLGEVGESLGIKVGDPVDGELVGGALQGLLEVEERFGAGFDHRVGDEGVVVWGECGGELLCEELGGGFA